MVKESEVAGPVRSVRSLGAATRSNIKAALMVLTAGERVANGMTATPTVEAAAPSQLGDVARSLYDAGQYNDAEYVLWEVLRTSPRAPTSTYLLGLCLLFEGKLTEGRRMIERAYELRHWLDDRVNSPQVFEMLDQVEASFPEWEWPRYQRLRERWRAVDLDLGNAVEHIASSAEHQLSFVQIGANDGRSGDPLRGVIPRHALTGLFVEPQADPFERLQERYGNVPDLRFAQVAITEVDGPVTLFTDPSRTTLGTLTPDRNIMRDRSASSVGVTVDGRTFGSLVAEFGLGDFDMLQLDTEGFDYKILRQVPLNAHRVSIVNMEYFCLPVSERLAAGLLLEEAGFALFFGRMDVLAVRLDRFEERFCITRIDR
jgi:FkbM family methyltransferase